MYSKSVHKFNYYFVHLVWNLTNIFHIDGSSFNTVHNIIN